MLNEPWSVIYDNELKLLRMLINSVGKLERGCECGYDHRCNMCDDIISAKDIAKKLVNL